ncbi:peptidoglycan-binding domain-containing protein [Rudaeicoccus suwonensis]|nr:peptidoglycan-binding domain-containing protein [Rudaeicoccus suwonensis]
MAPAASAATPPPTGPAGYATGCPVVGGGQGTASAIRIIQGKLNKLDLAGLTVDGVNGPATTAAIKTFQRSQFITADGVVGTDTWLKLGGCNSTVTPTYTGWVAMGGGSMQDQANIYQSPSFSAKVLGHYGAYAKVTGTLTGEWVRTSAGYVDVGTLENTTSAPASRNGKLATTSMCAVPLAWNAQHSFSGGVLTYTKTTQRYLNCIALWHLADLQNAFKAHFGKFATIDLTYRSYAE